MGHDSFVPGLALLLAVGLGVSCAATSQAGSGSETVYAVSASSRTQENQKEFEVVGRYAEACSCRPPCPCELVGPDMTCEGMGVFQFDQGTYGGEDFSGTRLAYALYIGKELQIYLDAPNAEKREALEAFARAALAGFGPVKGVHDAEIELEGKDGKYTVLVDGGDVMKCTTEPVLDGDGKTPVSHHNTRNAINSTMYQGTCTGCTFQQGEMEFTLASGRNAYFNEKLKAKGKI